MEAEKIGDKFDEKPECKITNLKIITDFPSWIKPGSKLYSGMNDCFKMILYPNHEDPKKGVFVQLLNQNQQTAVFV